MPVQFFSLSQFVINFLDICHFIETNAKKQMVVEAPGFSLESNRFFVLQYIL